MIKLMNNVIPFVRYQDVTDWPLYQVREWCRENGWTAGFRINWNLSGQDKCIIERLRNATTEGN